jgi:hypothetical protein
MSVMPNPSDAEPGLILSLPPPKPYSLIISNLTIGAPPIRETIPLGPVSVPLPSFVRSKKNADGGPTIVRGASGTCGAGEMLAIIGGSGSGEIFLLYM